VVLLRRPARDRARRAHVHGLDLDDGQRWVAHLKPDGSFTKRVIYRDLGVDDHNNPSLVFRPDGRIAVFFSPHSGRFLPPPSHRPSKLRYRVSKRPFSISGFERVRHVLTNAPGKLGFTYPNPIQQKGKLLDRIYKFTDARGSAWPHDIALTSEGRPRIVYTRRAGHRDAFFYAYHNGERWVSRKIVDAGPGFPSFTSGGATLDHEDPRVVHLSRRTGAFHQVEAWFTPDNGRTWRSRQLTAEPDHYCTRPVTPRGLRATNLVLFTRGDRSTKGFTDFRTRIHALAGSVPPS